MYAAVCLQIHLYLELHDDQQVFSELIGDKGFLLSQIGSIHEIWHTIEKKIYHS
jgi:hypothetical protein